MPIRKYANARSTDRDSDYSVSEYSANHSVYTETTNNIHSNSTVIQKDSVLQTDSVITDTVLQQPGDSVLPTLTKALTRMQPRYKLGKAKRKNDPLAWRIEKILRRLRPMLSTENFIEVSQEFTTSDPMQRVALAEKLEKWLELSLDRQG